MISLPQIHAHAGRGKSDLLPRERSAAHEAEGSEETGGEHLGRARNGSAQEPESPNKKGARRPDPNQKIRPPKDWTDQDVKQAIRQQEISLSKNIMKTLTRNEKAQALKGKGKAGGGLKGQGEVLGGADVVPGAAPQGAGMMNDIGTTTQETKQLVVGPQPPTTTVEQIPPTQTSVGGVGPVPAQQPLFFAALPDGTLGLVDPNGTIVLGAGAEGAPCSIQPAMNHLSATGFAVQASYNGVGGVVQGGTQHQHHQVVETTTANLFGVAGAEQQVQTTSTQLHQAPATTTSTNMNMRQISMQLQQQPSGSHVTALSGGPHQQGLLFGAATGASHFSAPSSGGVIDQAQFNSIIGSLASGALPIESLPPPTMMPLPSTTTGAAPFPYFPSHDGAPSHASQIDAVSLAESSLSTNAIQRRGQQAQHINSAGDLFLPTTTTHTMNETGPPPQPQLVLHLHATSDQQQIFGMTTNAGATSNNMLTPISSAGAQFGSIANQTGGPFPGQPNTTESVGGVLGTPQQNILGTPQPHPQGPQHQHQTLLPLPTQVRNADALFPADDQTSSLNSGLRAPLPSLFDGGGRRGLLGLDTRSDDIGAMQAGTANVPWAREEHTGASLQQQQFAGIQPQSSGIILQNVSSSNTSSDGADAGTLGFYQAAFGTTSSVGENTGGHQQHQSQIGVGTGAAVMSSSVEQATRPAVHHVSTSSGGGLQTAHFAAAPQRFGGNSYFARAGAAGGQLFPVSMAGPGPFAPVHNFVTTDQPSTGVVQGGADQWVLVGPADQWHGGSVAAAGSVATLGKSLNRTALRKAPAGAGSKQSGEHQWLQQNSGVQPLDPYNTPPYGSYQQGVQQHRSNKTVAKGGNQETLFWDPEWAPPSQGFDYSTSYPQPPLLKGSKAVNHVKGGVTSKQGAAAIGKRAGGHDPYASGGAYWQYGGEQAYHEQSVQTNGAWAGGKSRWGQPSSEVPPGAARKGKQVQHEQGGINSSSSEEVLAEAWSKNIAGVAESTGARRGRMNVPHDLICEPAPQHPKRSRADGTTSHPPRHRRSLSAEHLGRQTPPLSLGSCGHPDFCCRPCLFLARGVCRHGSACLFCHHPHARRPTRLDKRHRQLLRQISYDETLHLFAVSIASRAARISSVVGLRPLVDRLFSLANMHSENADETFDREVRIMWNEGTSTSTNAPPSPPFLSILPPGARAETYVASADPQSNNFPPPSEEAGSTSVVAITDAHGDDDEHPASSKPLGSQEADLVERIASLFAHEQLDPEVLGWHCQHWHALRRPPAPSVVQHLGYLDSREQYRYMLKSAGLEHGRAKFSTAAAADFLLRKVLPSEVSVPSKTLLSSGGKERTTCPKVGIPKNGVTSTSSSGGLVGGNGVKTNSGGATAGGGSSSKQGLPLSKQEGKTAGAGASSKTTTSSGVVHPAGGAAGGLTAPPRGLFKTGGHNLLPVIGHMPDVSVTPFVRSLYTGDFRRVNLDGGVLITPETAGEDYTQNIFAPAPGTRAGSDVELPKKLARLHGVLMTMSIHYMVQLFRRLLEKKLADELGAGFPGLGGGGPEAAGAAPMSTLRYRFLCLAALLAERTQITQRGSRVRPCRPRLRRSASVGFLDEMAFYHQVGEHSKSGRLWSELKRGGTTKLPGRGTE